MRIGLGNIDCANWVVRIVPDAAKRSLLFKDINSVEAVLGKEVSVALPIRDESVLK